MSVGRRKLAPLWALALALACTRHTGHAQDGSSESSYKHHPALSPIARGPGGVPLHGATVFPSLRTIPVVRASNPAHNGRVCSTWGSFHYKTFDGDVFRFPGLCNYVFSEHCGAAYEDFNIQLRRSQESAAPTLSRVLMKVDGMVIQLTKGSVLVNGHPVLLPFSQSGVLIQQSSSYTKVEARLGLVLMWNHDDSLLLELDTKYANKTCGLCGDFNGMPVVSELLSHNTKLTPMEFGNLQKMDDPTEQCQDPVPEPPRNCSTGFGICEELLHGQLFSGCVALVDVGSYLEACRQDLCFCEDTDLLSCVCHTLAEYSRQCTHAGGLPQDWRGPDFCPQKCPNNMQYHECRSPCADTCSNQEHSRACEDHCVAGCFCPEGTVLDDVGQTGCVPVSKCACVYNGAAYAPGATYSTDCTNCTCSGGRWSCQEFPCPGTCSVLGGAHFSTFDGKQYTVHGDCSYVLTKPCDSSAFTVLAELRRCGLTDSETCLKSVTLNLDGAQTVVVIKASGEVFLNQIYTQLPISAANVTIFRPSTFFIIAQTSLGLQLNLQLVPTMQLFMRLAPKLRGQTCGLCGNFNSIQADDFRTLSGVVEATAAAFFNTFKTQAACPNIRNSFEDPCSLSVENEKYAQHWCSQLTDADGPFGRCHAAVKPGTYYSNCMFDTCNCERSEDCLCAALSSYVHACAAKGVQLSGWRDGVCTKPMTTCPKSMTYHYHVSTCQPTCRSLSEGDITCSVGFIPVDGCICPKGTFLDDTGKCVQASNCPCYHRGSMIPNGESVHDSGAICTCTHGKLSCIGGQAPAPVCAAPMVFFDCRNATPGDTGAGCQKSCHTLDMTCYSPQCVPGCVCPDGLVADGEGGCITAEDCPCVHNEASYRAGQTIRVGCNTCTCDSRMWQCTDDPCLATCAVYGDGHYLTFDGQSYSFNGDCEYTLVQNHCGGKDSTQDSFRVVTENVPCGTTGTTCSKAIKIFLGGFELKLSHGKVEVIGTDESQEVPYTIRQMGIYLVVDTDIGLVLLWDKKTSIFINLSPEFKGRVCGLCGNFDDIAVNDFATRSWSVVGDVLEFGNSWKLSPSCPDALVPKDPCTANPFRKSWAQKQCSILHGPTFAACHAHVEPARYYEACVNDACACDSGGDCECFCTAVAAYAQACHEVGLCVSWRTPSICPLFCDYYNPEGQCEWHYQPCGAPCLRTCRNPRGDCLRDVRGLEGCYPKCPPEAPIFDEDKMQCVATCPTPPLPPRCHVHGKSYRPGAVVPSDKNCQSCLCTERGVECTYKAEACVCTYNGQRFHPGDVIYHTTDGTGGCISARCGANGTIERRVYPCSPTTPVPPTTFSFSTPPLVVSSTHTPSNGPSSAHTGPPSSAWPTTAGTSPRTRLPTASASLPPVCGEKCLWSPWMDVSRPGRGADSGDFDTLENLRAHGYRVCESPRSVECRAEDAPGVPLRALGQRVQCSPDVGLTCRNREQASGLCYNYQIRVQCCTPLACSTSSSPAQTTPPTTSKTTETQASGSSAPSSTPGTVALSTARTTPAPGTATSVKKTFSTPSPPPVPATSTSSMSTTAPGTSVVSSKPTPTEPSTSSCLQELCTWTEWIDGSYPAPGINGGDFDTFQNLRDEGYTFCESPRSVQCRAESFPNTPLADLGQDVICSRTEGLICLNKNQLPPICYNYEIRIQCCETVNVCRDITRPPKTVATTWPTPHPTRAQTQTTFTTHMPSASTEQPTATSRGGPTATSITQGTHTRPVTRNCHPRCNWTKWFDVDFPSPGSHGGDKETYNNIIRSGEKICRRPEEITRLQCRAKSHPEVSIEHLGQVVQCNREEGLVCRNQDQQGPFKMCLNYEVRVLCCETPRGCPVTSTPVTAPSTPSGRATSPTQSTSSWQKSRTTTLVTTSTTSTPQTNTTYAHTSSTTSAPTARTTSAPTTSTTSVPTTSTISGPETTLSPVPTISTTSASASSTFGPGTTPSPAPTISTTSASASSTFGPGTTPSPAPTTSTTSAATTSTISAPTTSTTSGPGTTPSPVPTTSTTSAPTTRTTSASTASTNSGPETTPGPVPTTSTTSASTTSTTSGPGTTPSPVPTTSTISVPTTSTTSASTTSTTSGPGTTPSPVPTTSTISVPTTSTTSASTTSTTSGPGTTPSPVPTTSTTSASTTSTTSAPTTSTISAPTTSTTSATTTSTTSAPTPRRTSAPTTSTISASTSSTTSATTTSTTSATTTSTISAPTTSTTLSPTTSTTSTTITSTTSAPISSTTSTPQTSTTSSPTTSTTSGPGTTSSPVPTTTTTSAPTTSTTSAPTTRTTSVPTRSTISTATTSTTSGPGTTPSPVPTTSTTSAPTTRTTSASTASTTSGPGTTPSPVPTTSTNSAPTTRTTSAPTTSTTSAPTTSTTSAPTSSTTSATTTSTISVPTTSTTSVPGTTPSPVPTTSTISVPTTSTTSASTTSTTSGPGTTPSPVPTTSTTSAPTTSTTSAPKTSTISAPTTSTTSAPTTSTTSTPTSSTTSTPQTSTTSASTTSITSGPGTTPSPVPTTSTTSAPTTSTTSAATTSRISAPTTSTTSALTTSTTSASTASKTSGLGTTPSPVPTTSTTSPPTTSTTSASTASKTSGPGTTPSPVPTTSTIFAPRTSTTSASTTSTTPGPGTTPSPVPTTSTASVSKTSTSHISISKTTHSQPVTRDCHPRCTWTKWFDVDFPSPGPHGGDKETYNNIIRSGEKICRRPEEITRLQCRAESHPEVSIEHLGQVVQCSREEGLVCRNQDQQGPFKMCLNYEVRVLCCETPKGCPVTSTPVTAPSTPSGRATSPTQSTYSWQKSRTTTLVTSSTTSSTQTSTTSAPTTSTTPASTPSTTSAPTTSTTSAATTSTTSAPTTSTTSTPQTTTSSAPTSSTTSAPTTSTTSAPTSSTTSAPTTSTISAPTTSTISAPTTSTTSAPTASMSAPTSTSSAPTSNTTSAPTTSTTSAPITSKISAPTTSTTSTPQTSTISAPTTSTTSTPQTSTTSSPTTSTTSAPITSTTSAPTTSTTSTPQTSISSAPTSSTTSAPTASTTSFHITSTTSPPTSSTSSTPQTSKTSAATSSTTSGSGTTPSPVPTTSTASVSKTSTSRVSVSKTTHSQPVTRDCHPRCTWTKWFDVDFPSPGPHGGDKETYNNIIRSGEKICRRPEEITRLQCRAESHPEVSIEHLGQVVQCSREEGLVCRNQDQQGPFKMCLNYEVRVLCCETPRGCPVTSTPVTAPSTPSGRATSPTQSTSSWQKSRTTTLVTTSTTSNPQTSTTSAPTTSTIPASIPSTTSAPTTSTTSAPTTSTTSAPTHRTTSGPTTSTTLAPTTSTTSAPTTSTNSAPTTSTISASTTSTISAPTTSTISAPTSSTTSTPQTSKTSAATSSTTSGSGTTPSPVPTTSTTSASTTSTTSAPTTSTTSGPGTAPSPVPSTSTTSAATTSTTSAPTTRTTSAPTSSMTSGPGTTPSPVPTTSTTSAPTTSTTSGPGTTPSPVPTTSTTSAPITSTTSGPRTTPSPVPTTSTTSAPTTSTTSASTASTTSGPGTTYSQPASPTSTTCCLLQPLRTSGLLTTSTNSALTEPAHKGLWSSELSSPGSHHQAQTSDSYTTRTTLPLQPAQPLVAGTTPSPVPTTSTTSAPTTSMTSGPGTTPSPVPTTSTTSASTTSTISPLTTSTTSAPTTSMTSGPGTTPSPVPTTSTTSAPTTSTTSGPGTTPSPVPTTSTTHVSKTSTSHLSVSKTTHSQPVTSDCHPLCAWTKWFDVDFPSPGPHGGDKETYNNIIRSGEKICRRPEEITRLQCRAESHPEVSIEHLGQVVQCSREEGLVCRNQDQQGPFKMCLNYEVRVLCCETPRGCPVTSVTPYGTSPTNALYPSLSTSVASASVASTSVASSSVASSSVAYSTQTCFCNVADRLYPAGSTIYHHRDLAGHCYYARCSQDCQVVRRVDSDCPSTTLPPAPATSPSTSTSEPVTELGCPNAVPPRKKGETWATPNCSEATCEGNNVISLRPRTCPRVEKPTCANGYPAVKVADQDGCCHHYQCQCVCSGWGDPHYITFDGTYYTFLDNCTYVLVQQIVPVYGHFRVLVDNYFCGAEDGLSCPRSIILEYHQDRVVLTRKPVHGVMTNEIIFNNKVVGPGFRKNGIVVSRIGIKMYATIPELGVQVMFSGLIFSVEVPFSKFANNTEGQCGTCTNDRKDECRTPRGTVVASCSEMSGLWNVSIPDQPACHRPHPTPTTVRPTTVGSTTVGPTTPPAPCLPSPICQLILSKVFEPCHTVIPPLPFYEGCVFDRCHMTDLDVVCSSLELYAALCASHDICIDWRGRTGHMCRECHHCPQGPKSLVRGTGTPVDHQGGLGALLEAGPITEGCFCPEGMTLFSTSVQVCVPTGCPRCLGPHGEPVKVGHTVSMDCQECTCEAATWTLTCRPKLCPLPPACPLPGFVPVPATPQAGQCCPQYSCACNTSRCPAPVGCPEGARAIPTYEEGACCPVQNCSWTVCSINGTLYQPGAVVSSSLCETCRCELPGGPPSDAFVVSCETQICNTHCPVGFEYQEQSGQCCGTCVQVACVTNTSKSPAHLFYPGETWSDPGNHCVTHECEKHRDGLVVVTTKKACPPLSCSLDEARMSKDGCCRFCPPPPPPYQNQSTCAVYHRSQIIQQQGCSSSEPVRLAYCRGNCGDSSSMYSLEGNMVEHRCQCCQELRTSLRNVTLHCTDGSSRAFSYTQVEECGCMGRRCPAPGDTQHSEEAEPEPSPEAESGSWERGVPVSPIH
uniref:Mucin 5AC, oligomeric mucus/gel-forming n=1 Tax=Pan troglodytes TaxID=9598 RepID=A0A2I3SAQ5_PANTR